MADQENTASLHGISEAQRARVSQMVRDVSEESYRRGYQQAFEQAAHHVQTLKNGGTVRVQEVANLLLAHAMGPLVDWRGEAMGDNPPFVKPPRLEFESWWLLKRKVYQRDGRQCKICGAQSGPFEIDHIKPVAEGGLPTLENLRVSCRTCNRSRPRSQGVFR